MYDKDRVIMLLSRAEINIMAAEDILKKRDLNVLLGELKAANNVIDSIRKDTMSPLIG